MEVQVQSLTEETSRAVTLDDRIFGIEPHRAVLHQAVVAQLANRRQGTADTRTRSEVAGSTRKPWRQKGTGRARQGSRRAPHWRGGGIVFGPHPRSFHQRLPRKMRRLALRSVLSDKAGAGAVRIVDRLDLADGRTKTLLGALERLQAQGRILLVLAEVDELVRRAAGNLPNVFVTLPNGLSVLELLSADAVIFTEEAAHRVEELLGEPRTASEGSGG